MTFLKFSDIKSKTVLKNQIIKGLIKVYECNTNYDMNYRLVENVNTLLNLWDGFRFNKKYQDETNIATACLGTSFQYKFTN